MNDRSIMLTKTFTTAVLLSVLACNLFVLNSTAQVGTVISHQKISDSQGSFGGILLNDVQFGTSVTSIGDLDGDGILDIAVGAGGDYGGGVSRGAVWILFLNSNGKVKSYQKINDVVGNFTGNLDNFDGFGGSVCSLGDLDCDGIIDLAVGAAGDGDGGYRRGAIWILFLNSDGTVKSHQKISNTQGNFTGSLDNNDFFGASATSLSDLNGDGIIDIAVGSLGDDDGDTNKGAVWILFLNSDGTVKSHQKISATQGNFTGSLDFLDFFGHSVASLNDLDGDGNTDIAVGAYHDDDGGSNTGAVWVLFLDSSGMVISHQKISKTQGNFTGTLNAGHQFGTSIVSVGDLDGNGYTDIGVGAYGDDDGGAIWTGAIWIVFLNSNGTVISQQKISNTQGNFSGTLDNDRFGISIASIGDLNGDGFADVVVGEFLGDDGGASNSDRGAVWVLFLKGKLKLNTSSLTLCSGDSVSIGNNPIATGGTSPYTYSWAPSTGLDDSTLANPKAFPVITTAYTITVTDGNSDQSADTIILTVYASLTANAGTDAAICPGDTTSIGGSPTANCGTFPYSYNWTPSITLDDSTLANPKVFPTVTTTYIVIITDSNNNQAADTINVIINPALIIDVGLNAIICSGDSASIGGSPTATGGIAPYVYCWLPITGLDNPTIANPTAFPTTTTNYFVTITDSSGCTSTSSSVIVTVNDNPNPIIIANDSTDFCQGDSVGLSTSTGYISYFWSSVDTFSNINIYQNDTVVVTVTDSNGCSGTSDSLIIKVYSNPNPVIIAGGPTNFCQGDSVELSTGLNYTSYLWSTGDSTSVITILQSDTVSVTVTDSNGCYGTSSDLIVTVNANPNPSITANDTTVFCQGDSVVIMTTGIYNIYGWSNGDSTQNIVVYQSGNYTVVVTDSNSCYDTSNTMIVTVNPLPVPVITAMGDTIFCLGDSVILTVNNIYNNYQWSNGDSTKNIIARQSGKYDVTVEDSNGCIGTSNSIAITANPLPPTPNITQNGDTLISSTATGYQWHLNDTLINGANSQYFITVQPGSYTVEITDSNGCESTSAPFILSNVISIWPSDYINIYPNPNRGLFQLEINVRGSNITYIKIYNILGSIVYQEDLLNYSESYTKLLNLKEFNSGIYFIRVQIGAIQYFKKIVIE
ncbi:MAG: FG-GAP repeat protein [Bacteroidetes bacterium]|nr:FG-GAP repeat protein [Bacteroidota bacterium]